MIACTHGPIAGTAAGLALCLALGAGADATRAEPVAADKRITAHYTITMIGVTIGQIAWAIDIGPNTYKTAASGKASGALSMLVNGEGRIATSGVIERSTTDDGGIGKIRLSPTFFSSNVTEDDETIGLQMTFENGTVKTLRTDAPIRDNMRRDGRIPVADGDRHGVSDPLTAMLIDLPATHSPGQEALPPAACKRLLKIYDGQRRYNLGLSYKRTDRLAVKRGYAGPVLVCAVVLRPIAGYRADSMLVKYAADQRGMEIWFAPIAGTPFIAPVRLLMPTMIGTLEISADRFEAARLKFAPPSPPHAPN